MKNDNHSWVDVAEYLFSGKTFSCLLAALGALGASIGFFLPELTLWMRLCALLVIAFGSLVVIGWFGGLSDHVSRRRSPAPWGAKRFLIYLLIGMAVYLVIGFCLALAFGAFS